MGRRPSMNPTADNSLRGLVEAVAPAFATETGRPAFDTATAAEDYLAGDQTTANAFALARVLDAETRQ
jgi:hypothetical protein